MSNVSKWQRVWNIECLAVFLLRSLCQWQARWCLPVVRWPKHIILQTNSSWKNNKHPAVSNFSNDIMEITWLPPLWLPGAGLGVVAGEMCLFCPPHRTQLLQMFWSCSTMSLTSPLHTVHIQTQTRYHTNIGGRHYILVPLYYLLIIYHYICTEDLYEISWLLCDRVEHRRDEESSKVESKEVGERQYGGQSCRYDHHEAK